MFYDLGIPGKHCISTAGALIYEAQAEVSVFDIGNGNWTRYRCWLRRLCNELESVPDSAPPVVANRCS